MISEEIARAGGITSRSRTTPVTSGRAIQVYGDRIRFLTNNTLGFISINQLSKQTVKEQIDDYLTDKYTMDDIEEIKSITLQQLKKDVVTFSKQFRYDFRL